MVLQFLKRDYFTENKVILKMGDDFRSIERIVFGKMPLTPFSKILPL